MAAPTTPDGKVLTTVRDGAPVVFHSEKQRQAVESELRRSGVTKIFRQLGKDIVLHCFFQHHGHWLGYAVTVGARGGKTDNRNCYVLGDTPETLKLCVRG